MNRACGGVAVMETSTRKEHLFPYLRAALSTLACCVGLGPKSACFAGAWPQSLHATYAIERGWIFVAVKNAQKHKTLCLGCKNT